MPKIDNKFTAYFINTTTAPGTPITGLSPTINIRETNGSLVVNNQAMVELGGGHYIYTFVGYNAYTDYLYDINPNDDRVYIQSGVTTDGSLNKALDDLRVGGGGSSLGNISQTIQSSITRAKKEIIERIDEIPQEDFTPLFDEIKGNIAIAKTDIISKIPEIKFEEKEAKKLGTKIDKLNKTLVGYIEEVRDEKDSIGAIAVELDKLEMEDIKKQKEEEMKEKEEERKMEELIEKELEKLEEEDKEEQKKELEKELEETLKEAEEIKKELNSL